MRRTLTEYEHRHIKADPQDVEDFGTATITFSDNTKAIIIATDTLLGGSRNYVEAYCNDAVLKGNLTMNDMMSTYTHTHKYRRVFGIKDAPISLLEKFV